MENLLTPLRVCDLHKSENLITKRKLLYKYEISEKKKNPNNLRNNNFRKIDSSSKRFLSKQDSITQTKVKENFPLIYIKKNTTKIYFRNESHNLTNNKYLNEKTLSKKEIDYSSLFPNKEFKTLKIDNINKSNNITLTEASTNKRISKKISINFSQPKKLRRDFNDLLEKIDKSPVKVMKLKKINLYNEKFLEEPKNDINNDNQEIVFNPIKISINDENNFSNNNKLIIGSKYNNFDLSPDSISKNLYYSKLDNYYRKISENKPLNMKKINLKKLSLKNNKLKDFHFKRMRECRKLIDDTIKQVDGVKNNCLNWVKELKEKYTNNYERYGFDNINENI